MEKYKELTKAEKEEMKILLQNRQIGKIGKYEDANKMTDFLRKMISRLFYKLDGDPKERLERIYAMNYEERLYAYFDEDILEGLNGK